MEFLRQEYCSGLSFSSPGDLPYPEIEPTCPPCQEWLSSLSLNHFVLAAKKGGRGKRLKGFLMARLCHWWDSTNPLFAPNSCSLTAWHSTHTLTCTHAYAHTCIHRCIPRLCAPVHTPPIHTHTPPCSHTDVHTFAHTSTSARTHTQAPVYPDVHTYLFFLKNQPSI